MKNLTNRELIEALSKLNPDAIVTINIKQYNDRYGKQVNIFNSNHSGYQTWLTGEYTGATITVHLPEKAIISRWPNN